VSMQVHMSWHGDEIKRALARASPTALYQAGEDIRGVSIRQAPLDTGELIRSSATQADDQAVTISYDTPYAVRWHENDANFQRGRKKKYLEDPINDPTEQQRVLRILRQGVKEGIGL